ncbi:MAG: HU family DNA-binding protein [Tannerellaceae bacterium]|jgi:predicted histone-like DNA-binding protein|nr:HU family DNA-binding protein [Tannerellaceae bacterium]
MTAHYKLVRNPNPKKDGQTQPLHARFVPIGTASTDDIIEQIVPKSSFSAADYKGIIQLLQDALVDFLMFGYDVELEGIGTFTVSLQSPPVMNKKEIRSESISFRDVKFRASKALKMRLKTMPVFRAQERQRKTFSLEECEKRLIWYLEKNRYITSRIYMSLNQCGKTKAAAQLKQFRKEGKIVRNGYGSTTFYTKGEE